MNKTVVALTMLASGAAHAGNIALPAPETTGGKPLMQAMAERRTEREFADKPVSAKDLSNILWAAYGFNRPGKRTIPTARNEQGMDVYVLTKDGSFLYKAKDNVLEQVGTRDLREFLGAQDFARKAPLTLLFVEKPNKYAGTHAGSAYQNVGLYCASAGLNNVVRGIYDADALAKALNLGDKAVTITQTVGYPV